MVVADDVGTVAVGTVDFVEVGGLAEIVFDVISSVVVSFLVVAIGVVVVDVVVLVLIELVKVKSDLFSDG